MTDKQIIIDGVDVEYCKRRIGKDNFCRYYKRPCSENNYNCIWKKYLRKEQELDQLKAQNETYKKMFEDEDVLFALNEIRTGERNLWFNKVKKLEQTLTEIKKLAEREVKHAPDGETFSCPEIKQILQKISEVENE